MIIYWLLLRLVFLSGLVNFVYLVLLFDSKVEVLLVSFFVFFGLLWNRVRCVICMLCIVYKFCLEICFVVVVVFWVCWICWVCCCVVIGVLLVVYIVEDVRIVVIIVVIIKCFIFILFFNSFRKCCYYIGWVWNEKLESNGYFERVIL